LLKFHLRLNPLHTLKFYTLEHISINTVLVCEVPVNPFYTYIPIDVVPPLLVTQT